MAIPVNGSTLIPAYYSFYRPRKDERLSWPSWLTYSGCLPTLVVTAALTGKHDTLVRRAPGWQGAPDGQQAKNLLLQNVYFT